MNQSRVSWPSWTVLGFLCLFRVVSGFMCSFLSIPLVGPCCLLLLTILCFQAWRVCMLRAKSGVEEWRSGAE